MKEINANLWSLTLRQPEEALSASENSVDQDQSAEKKQLNLGYTLPEILLYETLCSKQLRIHNKYVGLYIFFINRKRLFISIIRQSKGAHCVWFMHIIDGTDYRPASIIMF